MDLDGASASLIDVSMSNRWSILLVPLVEFLLLECEASGQFPVSGNFKTLKLEFIPAQLSGQKLQDVIGEESPGLSWHSSNQITDITTNH